MKINFNKFNHSIIGIEMDDDESDYLNLLTDGGYKFKFEAVGDCCSRSLISKYNEDFSVLIGKVIKNIKEINLPDYVEEDNDNGDYTTTHFYEIKFKYNDGSFIFQMKNYSNGYYDGYLISSVGY